MQQLAVPFLEDRLEQVLRDQQERGQDQAPADASGGSQVLEGEGACRVAVQEDPCQEDEAAEDVDQEVAEGGVFVEGHRPKRLMVKGR